MKTCHLSCCVISDQLYLILTGWPWSRSGSNLVINMLHLSRSFSCRGNQGTVMCTGGGFPLKSVNLHECASQEATVFTFFLWDWAHVLHGTLQRVDEDTHVWAVNFTHHEELQVCCAILQILSWTAFDVEEFGIKCLLRTLNKQIKDKYINLLIWS